MLEIKVLKELDHPHIIKVYDSFEIEAAGEEYYVIITEYCENGDLLSYATNTGFKDEMQRKKIIYEFLEGIKYLHKKGISHGDIKSENVLLDSNFSPKLCDFGFCRTKKVAGDESKKGTFYYAAPELFVRGEFDTIKTDIWAIGITLYSLFELQFPFKDGKQSCIVKQIMGGNLSISRSLDFKVRQIVRDCTQVMAASRPTIDNIMNSDYFSDIRFDLKLNHNFSPKKKIIQWKPKCNF